MEHEWETVKHQLRASCAHTWGWFAKSSVETKPLAQGEDETYENEPNAFDPKTNNDPVQVENRKMTQSTLKNSNIRNSTIVGSVLAGSTFEDTDLSGCTFKNVNLSKCSFHDISFGRTIITHACFEECEIPHGNIDNLKIAGVKVKDLLEAYAQVHGELPDPGHHDRH